jgi:dTDP-glucose 4,6-dehydratase
MIQPPLPADDLDWVLSLTPSFWTRFRNSRIFITGGTGFIGNWLIQSVQRANDALGSQIELVILTRDAQNALTRHPRILSRPDIHLIEGDIASFDEPPGPLDLCIHAATDVVTSVHTSNALQHFDSIVNGTRRVLDVSAKKGVTRFLLTSSGAVYGPQPVDLQLIAEDYMGAPSTQQLATAYGNGKRAAEWLTCAFSAQGCMQAVVARIFALMGPGMPLNGPFAAGNFIRDAIGHHPITVQGDGRTVRSYLYMSDLCIWLIRMLESGQPGQAYNVGAEPSVSILDLASQITQASGELMEVKAQHTSESTSLPSRYVPDTNKARKSLSLEQTIPLDKAITKSLAWNRLALSV